MAESEKKAKEAPKVETPKVGAPTSAPQQPQLTKEQAIQNAFNSTLNLVAREINLLYQGINAILNPRPPQPPTAGN